MTEQELIEAMTMAMGCPSVGCHIGSVGACDVDGDCACEMDARRALAAIRAAGFVVVPVVATPEMAEAGELLTDGGFCAGHAADPDAVWEAMLNASPLATKP